MSILLFIDSAWPVPQSQIPTGVVGVAGYLGGDTPHPWSEAEWVAQKSRYRLPIYVRSNPPGPGASVDVTAAVAHLRVIGCPEGSLVAWDMETAVDAVYIREVYDGLRTAGYKLIVYGSQSYVFGNDNPDGLFWAADWTDVEHLAFGSQMTQYVSFANYDLSIAESTLPFWDTQRVVPPVLPGDVTVTVKLPELTLGADDANFPHWFVRRVQGILNSVYGAHLIVDGMYGPSTEGAVKTVQGRYGLAVDGVVGLMTWTRLIGG